MTHELSSECPEYLEAKLRRGGMHTLLIMALNGELKGKPGPKPRYSDWEWNLINDSVDFLAENYREERDLPGYNRIRGEMAPVEKAYEVVASKWKISCGRTLQNRLSSLKLR